MKTIVTITPLKVECDSRTFKQAESCMRLGYKSIVVEGGSSNLLRENLPFELISIDGVPRENNNLKLEANQINGPQQTKNNSNLRKTIRSRVGQAPKIISIPLSFIIFLGWVLFYYYRYYILTRRCTPKADIYYLHSFYNYPVVKYMCRKYKAKYIYDAHDFYSGIEENSEKDVLEKVFMTPFNKRIERKCIQNSSAIVTVSEGISELLNKTFKCNSEVLMNCQDSRHEHKVSSDIKNDLGLGEKDFLIMIVGNAKKGMAFKESLEALKYLPKSVHFAFLGNNYEIFINELISKDIKQRIHIVHPVKPFEVVSYIKTAQAALIMYFARSVNYTNCLPNGFFQSISAELPLLYPELAEIKKVCDRFKIGVPINTNNSCSIKDGIIELVNNENLYRQYRINLNMAKQSLDWVEEEKKLKLIIDKILEE